MGRISLSIYQKITLSLFLLCGAAVAKEIEGVKIPETMVCEGKELPLSGAGLRTATFFKVKIYVLAFYAKEKVQTSKPEELIQRPLCFHLTYLRDFDNSDVDKAWDYQFDESADFKYPGLKDHIKELKKYFGEIKGERSETLILTEEAVKVFDNKEFKGEIKSKDFQKSFLSIWFGKNPPTKALKDDLLK